MYVNHRHPTSTSHFLDILEKLKVEWETMEHDIAIYKVQRDDYELKLETQLQEICSMQETAYELERQHKQIKQRYEEEIVKLQRQVEQANQEGFDPAEGREGNQPASKKTKLDLGSPSNDIFQFPSRGLGVALGKIGPLDKGPIPNIDSMDASEPASGAKLGSAGSNNATEKKEKGEKDSGLRAARWGGGSHADGAPASKLSSSFSSFENGPARKKNDNDSPPTEAATGGSSASTSGPSTTAATKEADRDWLCVPNPAVRQDLSVELQHNLQHTSVVCCAKFSTCGKYIATGANKVATIWDVGTAEKLSTFSSATPDGGDSYVRSLTFSPDSKLLVAGAEDKTVKVWDIARKEVIQQFQGHASDIYSLDYAPDSSFIVSGSGDGKTKLWRINQRECVQTLTDDDYSAKGVTSVAISPTSSSIAAGSLDCIVRLWDAGTGTLIRSFNGHTDSVYSVAFSPNGNMLASGSLDKSLKLWDVRESSGSNSKCIQTLRGHTDYVLSVAFSADGNWLFSGSKDRSVQFWETRSKLIHMMLQGHKNSVISVAVNPEIPVLATGSGDNRARLWKYSYGVGSLSGDTSTTEGARGNGSIFTGGE